MTGDISYWGPHQERLMRERQARLAEAMRHWWQPCPCGSGKTACECRCRVELTEKLIADSEKAEER